MNRRLSLLCRERIVGYLHRLVAGQRVHDLWYHFFLASFYDINVRDG